MSEGGRIGEVVASSDVLNEVLGRYCDVDVHVIDLDAWTAADLVSVQILMDGELQRRYDENEGGEILFRPVPVSIRALQISCRLKGSVLLQEVAGPLASDQLCGQLSCLLGALQIQHVLCDVRRGCYRLQRIEPAKQVLFVCGGKVALSCATQYVPVHHGCVKVSGVPVLDYRPPRLGLWAKVSRLKVVRHQSECSARIQRSCDDFCVLTHRSGALRMWPRRPSS